MFLLVGYYDTGIKILFITFFHLKHCLHQKKFQIISNKDTKVTTLSHIESNTYLY